MKVLIVGIGSIALKHINALKDIDASVEVYGLRSNGSVNNLDAVTNIYSWEEVPRDIDFVIISNPTHKHAEAIREAVKLNKPLFIEKPSVDSLKSAAEISDLIQESKLKNYIACNIRFNETFLKFKDYLAEYSGQKVNEVSVYCGSYLPDWRATDFRQSYSATSIEGGGVHRDLIHELDYIYWLFGKPKEVVRKLNSDSDLNIHSTDAAYYLIQYDEFVTTIQLNYFRKIPKRFVEVVLSNDLLQLDLIQNRILINEKEVFRGPDDAMLQSYKHQLSHFIDCIAQDTNPINTFEDSVEVLKICLDE